MTARLAVYGEPGTWLISRAVAVVVLAVVASYESFSSDEGRDGPRATGPMTGCSSAGGGGGGASASTPFLRGVSIQDNLVSCGIWG